MLRDDKDVALNDVLVACRKAAGHYGQAAGLADGPERVAAFQRLALRRQADADRLETLVRRCGYLPEEPHKDKQDISHLITLTRSAAAPESGCPLAARGVDLEQDLEAKIVAAKKMDWPPQACDLLQAILETCRPHREELAAMCA